jgi:MazG family protein
MTFPACSPLDSVLTVMAQLRAPQTGCPWDLEQDFASLAPYLLEESYEVVEAIESGNIAALQEELGDVLLQVVFHSQIAAEKGLFTFADVAESLRDKLVRRHPHVFGETTEIRSAAEQTSHWEALKANEKTAKGHRSVLDDIPHTMPALARAEKLSKRAARVGFDWETIDPVFAKLHEEIHELQLALATQDAAQIQDELGDVLFVCVNLARHLKTNAETALRGTNRKFEQRFRYVETCLQAEGRTPESASLDEMEALWQDAKKHPLK